MGTRIEIVEKSLDSQKNIDVLVVPFRTYKFELYGGHLIKTTSFNYREKIRNKSDLPYGQAYLQKCVGNEAIKLLSFIKLGEGKENEMFGKGLADMFTKISMTKDKLPMKKIVIPICMELGDIS